MYSSIKFCCWSTSSIVRETWGIFHSLVWNCEICRISLSIRYIHSTILVHVCFYSLYCSSTIFVSKQFIYFIVYYFRCLASPQKYINTNYFFSSVNEEVYSEAYQIAVILPFFQDYPYSTSVDILLTMIWQLA